MGTEENDEMEHEEAAALSGRVLCGRVTFENSHIALTGLLCRPKLAVTPYGSVEHVMCRIWGWPCAG